MLRVETQHVCRAGTSHTPHARPWLVASSPELSVECGWMGSRKQQTEKGARGAMDGARARNRQAMKRGAGIAAGGRGTERAGGKQDCYRTG